MSRLKYLSVYTLPITVWIAFFSEGWMTFLPIIVFFGLVPLVELIIPPDDANMDERIAIDEAQNPLYDFMLFVAVPIQIATLIAFLMVISNTTPGTSEYTGRVLAMGFMCGVLGINVGHELGHRHSRFKQFMGEVLLLTSLNTHFLPYHNAGHHKNVGLANDPATAKRNEWLYTFWLTSHFGSYIQAWQIQMQLLRQEGHSFLSSKNRMFWYGVASVGLVALIYVLMGMLATVSFVIASVLGIMLLETVNYIEHYGLTRKVTSEGFYEKVKHHHSWNSDHPLGRILLFNLSRHSDHHYNGSKKYQVLESVPGSPCMPTGYPGMMVMALIPPLWIWVMNRRIDKLVVDKSMATVS